SRDIEPKDQASYLGGSKERRQVLGVAGGDAAPLLQMQERVFNQVPMTIQVFVEFTGHLAILARGNLRSHALCLSLLNDRVAVIALVGDQVLGTQTFDQG